MSTRLTFAGSLLLTWLVCSPTCFGTELEPRAVLKGHKAPLTFVAFLPDGKRVISGSADGVARVWDAAEGKELLTLNTLPPQEAEAYFALGPDGRLLAGTSRLTNKTTVREYPLVTLWTIGESFDIKGTLKGEEGDARFLGLAIAPNGKVLAVVRAEALSGLLTSAVNLYDLDTNEYLARISEADSLQVATFAPDGTTLVVADQKGLVRLCKTSTGKPRQTIEANKGGVAAVVVDPKSTTLATGGADRMVRLWDLHSGKEKQSLEGHDDAVLCLAYAPGGRYLASGGKDNTVVLWDTTTGRSVGVLEAHLDAVTCLGFSPDGKSLVTGSRDKHVKIWDVSRLLEAKPEK